MGAGVALLDQAFVTPKTIGFEAELIVTVTVAVPPNEPAVKVSESEPEPFSVPDAGETVTTDKFEVVAVNEPVPV
jgi:hypothetical protein